jgi:hypothetical protein
LSPPPPYPVRDELYPLSAKERNPDGESLMNYHLVEIVTSLRPICKSPLEELRTEEFGDSGIVGFQDLSIPNS